jgi:hypothetical protein
MKYKFNVYRNTDLSEKDVQTLTNMLEGKPAPENGAGGSGGGAVAGAGGEGGGDNGASAAAAAGAAGVAGGSAAPGAGGAAAPGAGGAAGGGASAADEEFETHDLESLGFSSIDDIKKMREDYTRVQNELNEAKAKPKFASKKAETLYEFANRHEGMELETAKQFLELVNLDLTKVADHDLRFRAFSLRPEMRGYSQDEIHALFIDDELKNFGDPNVENGQTDVQKIRAKGATAQARESLEKLQEEYKKAPAQEAQRSPEQIAADKAAYTDFVKKGLTGFDGIASKVSATLEDGKKVESSFNFKLDAEKQLPAVINAVVDPAGWWENVLKKHGAMVDGQEQPNVSKFSEIVTYLEFKDELLNQAYQQGRHDQIAHHASTHRNAGAGGEGGAGGSEAPVKTEQEGMLAGAMKTIGLPTT